MGFKKGRSKKDKLRRSKELAKVSASYGEAGRKEHGAWGIQRGAKSKETLNGRSKK